MSNDNFLGQQVYPGLSATSANKKLKDAYKEIDKIKTEDISSIDASHKDQLVKDFENQLDRKKGIEDKVKAILFIVSISMTAMTFSLSNATGKIDSIGIVLSGLLVISIWYFIFSAIRCIQTLNIRAFHIIQTDIEREPIKVKSVAPDIYLKELTRQKLQNDNINIQLANLAYASFTLARNGIILFALYFILALSNKYMNFADNSSVRINQNINVKVNDSLNLVIPYSLKLEIKGSDFQVDTSKK